MNYRFDYECLNIFDKIFDCPHSLIYLYHRTDENREISLENKGGKLLISLRRMGYCLSKSRNRFLNDF